MDRLLWKTLVWAYTQLGYDPQWATWNVFAGFRRACGGRWELWEVDPYDLKVSLWLRPHGTPPFATTNHPLVVEEYHESHNKLVL